MAQIKKIDPVKQLKKSDFVDKDSYRLNIGNEDADYFVSVIENDIVKKKEEILAFDPKFKDAETLLLAAQKQMAEAQGLYDREKSTLDGLHNDLARLEHRLLGMVQFRGKNATKKEIRVLRTTSHNDDKGKYATSTKTRINWLVPAAEVLKETGMFMKPDDLYDAMIKKFPDFAAQVEINPQVRSAMKARFRNTMAKTAERNEIRKNGIAVISVYKGFIGLQIWMNGAQPIATKMKQFTSVHNGHKEAKVA
jgi:hypothetical protein